MKRILRIAWLSLVSAVIVTALGTMTSVLFGFPVKALTTSMLLGMLAIMFVVCVLLYYAVSLVPRKYEPHKRYLYQLIIGKLAPFAVLSLVDVVLVLVVATLWFHVPLRGSVRPLPALPS